MSTRFWMSGLFNFAAGAAKVVLYCSLLTLGIWLVWYGQYQWGGYVCKTFKPADLGRHRPAGWASSTPCAVTWTKPLLRANLGFLFVVPAVAALASIAVIGFRDQNQRGCSRKQSAVALMQSWGSAQLPPSRVWLWLCDGLNAKDAIVIAAWAVYNTVWYYTILSSALAKSGPSGLSPTGFAKGLGSLMAPNVVLLLFPVSRGSVISNALGLAYPEGIRYHRWVGQWVALLTTLHGLTYWLEWAAAGTWTRSVLQNGRDASQLFGGVALLCTILLWVTSQEPIRRRFYHAYKVLHHIGFWGFMLMGCAHWWPLFWYFVPGMLLYAVDGVFRLHQMFAGCSGSLTGAAAAHGASNPGVYPVRGVNVEVLKVDLCPSETMCSLLLAAAEFGVARAGIVWLNVPAVSLLEWHAFDYTASEITLSTDGRVCNGWSAGNTVDQGEKQTALSVHIKAYSRWTKSLVSQLAKGARQQLTIRIQGPYAGPPVAIGQPDGIVVVAGGNGIASALPVFEELSATGVPTQGLPALLLWACRKGYEFEFMAAPVLTAARALGLNLTVHLYITDGAHPAHIKGSPLPAPDPISDTAPAKDLTDGIDQNKSPVTTLTLAASGSASSESVGANAAAETAALPAGAGGAGDSSMAVPTSLCPVVAFGSFTAQMGFKVVLHLAVFAGFLIGLFTATYIGGAVPLEAGQLPWPTCKLGPVLVLIPAGCAVGLGLLTVWASLLVQRLTRGPHTGLRLDRSPAAAVAAMSGYPSELLPAASRGQASGKGASLEPASLLLRIPSASGVPEILPVATFMPSISSVVQGWLGTLQQLPSSSAGKDHTCSNAPGRLYCVVYACGPTPLDHATQAAVASISAKQHMRSGVGARQVMLQFVRKAQAL